MPIGHELRLRLGILAGPEYAIAGSSFNGADALRLTQYAIIRSGVPPWAPSLWRSRYVPTGSALCPTPAESSILPRCPSHMHDPRAASAIFAQPIPMSPTYLRRLRRISGVLPGSAISWPRPRYYGRSHDRFIAIVMLHSLLMPFPPCEGFAASATV
jgi:hypothetical protein